MSLQQVELSVGTISGNCHSVSATASWSVREVKEAITTMTELPSIQQRLLFGTRVLRDPEILREFLPLNQPHHELLLVVCLDEKKADIITSLVLGQTTLHNVEEQYHDDFDVVEAAVRHDGMNLEYAKGEPRKDSDLVLAAVAQNGFALSFAPLNFSSDPDAVLLAVKSNAFAMTFAHDSLQKDVDFGIKAVRTNPFARDYLESRIRTDARFEEAFPSQKAATLAASGMFLGAAQEALATEQPKAAQCTTEQDVTKSSKRKCLTSMLCCCLPAKNKASTCTSLKQNRA